MRPALIFSIASRGYALAYRRCLGSQRRYADAHGFAYACMRDLPPHTAREASWLKIPLLIAALRSGWPWVVWLDADAEVRPACPDFRTLERPGRDVYLAPGHSGRVNAGVIVARNTADALRLFEDMLDACDIPVVGDDQAPYENGHLIRFTRGKPFVELIDRRWNNAVEPDAPDCIRHYTGPMKAALPFAARALSALLARRPAPRHAGSLGARLDRLARRVVASEPVFSGRHLSAANREGGKTSV